MTVNNLNIKPPHYKTWRALWEELKHENIYDQDRIKFEYMSNSNGRPPVNILTETYEIDVDFLKARCFEEIEPNLPTPQDIRILDNGVLTTDAFNVLHKISDLCSR